MPKFAQVTPLKILDFPESPRKFSHFEWVFVDFMGINADIRHIFNDFVPLSFEETREPTFFQWSHK